MRTGRWIFVIAGIVAAATEAEAAQSFLGGFRPVAGEEGARALWVNPAAIGANNAPTAAADVVWYEEDQLRIGDVRRLSVVAAMPLAAYGLQWNFADEAGVPDWTFAVGKRFPVARLMFGVEIEWRGGEDSSLDGGVGAVLPVGREWRLAAAGTHLFEPETQGVKSRQTWQLGAAWRPGALLGHVTYDARFEAGDREHWFGLAFDRTRPLRFGGAADIDGNWSLTAGVVFGAHFVGGGVRDPNEGARREFAVWDWTGSRRRGPGGPRTGIRR
jgi:hypothetical protein